MLKRTRLVVALVIATSGLLTTRALPASAATLPSVFCEFEEPFRWIVITPEGILVEDHEDGAKFTRYQPVTVRGSLTTSMRFGMPKGSGSDAFTITATSGRYSHSAEWNNEVGDCRKYPTGYVLRTVIRVAEGDALNIRASGNVSAEVVGTYDNGELAFVKPTKSKWWKTAFVDGGDEPSDDEPSGDEPEPVQLGWVNSAFIAKTIPRIAHA